MLQNHFLRSCGSFLFFTFAIMVAPPAFAKPSSPQQILESFLNGMLVLNFPISDESKHAELVQKVSDHLDLETMGQKAIADHWNQMTPDDQQKYRALFPQLIETIAYRSSNHFLKTAKVTYPETKPDAAGVTVKSLVRQQGEEIDTEVFYHLSEKDKSWKIDDVILDGVSIVEDLKYQFNKIITQSQIAGLIDAMQKRLAEAEKQIRSASAV